MVSKWHAGRLAELIYCYRYVRIAYLYIQAPSPPACEDLQISEHSVSGSVLLL